MTILFCIAHRIIRNVKKHLIQHMTDTLDLLGTSCKLQGYIFLFRWMTEIVLYIFRKLIKVHFLKRNFTVAFIQSGQLYDICYQIGKTYRLMINPSGKFLDMICRNHSVHHQLRISGNGHQRCFQLMGYIGRKGFLRPLSALLPAAGSDGSAHPPAQEGGVILRSTHCSADAPGPDH